MCGVEAHVLVPERESSHDLVECAVVALNPIASREHAGECIIDIGKEKIDEKMKELVFIGGVELVDLDDCDVTEKKLQYDNTDSNDDDSPNADDIGVRDGPGLCSQTMDLNDESASKSLAL